MADVGDQTSAVVKTSRICHLRRTFDHAARVVKTKLTTDHQVVTTAGPVVKGVDDLRVDPFDRHRTSPYWSQHLLLAGTLQDTELSGDFFHAPYLGPVFRDTENVAHLAQRALEVLFPVILFPVVGGRHLLRSELD